MTSVGLAILHGLSLAALATVIGGLILDLLILPLRLPALMASRARLRRAVTCCLILLILAALAEAVFRIQAMSRGPLGAAIAQVPEVVARTHVGTILTVRVGLLVFAALLSLASPAPPRALCLLIALGVTLTMSLTGHAADRGDVTTAVALDWVHGVAASAWTGGLLGLAFAVLPRQAAVPAPVIGVIARHFSGLAGVCLLVVVATGIGNAWTQLGTISRLWTTDYGRLLLLKIALVGTLACLGAVNRYLVLPRLDGGPGRRGFGGRLFRLAYLLARGPRPRSTTTGASAQLSKYVAVEAAIVLAVFACTAALGEATPGRHTAFERRPASHVTNITPSQGSGTGSSRISGTVVPPPGDSARGRAIFVRLQCFTCHAVPDPRMSLPTRPGPDLAEAARHHPGYLVESIVNPNARIVDGPGYTDDRGLSTMPDYGEKMTVRQLADLVAYLKSLTAPSPPSAR